MSNPSINLQDRTKSSRKPLLIIAGVLLGVIFIGIGVIYLTQTASNLPSFFPGHVAVSTTIHHTKHALVAFVLAVCSFGVAWFGLGPAQTKQK